jgi:hypothetical protein
MYGRGFELLKAVEISTYTVLIISEICSQSAPKFSALLFIADSTFVAVLADTGLAVPEVRGKRHPTLW